MSIAPIVVVATLCLSADQPAGATQRPSREALARFVSAARTAEINRLTAEAQALDSKLTALAKSRKNVRRDRHRKKMLAEIDKATATAAQEQEAIRARLDALRQRKSLPVLTPLRVNRAEVGSLGTLTPGGLEDFDITKWQALGIEDNNSVVAVPYFFRKTITGSTPGSIRTRISEDRGSIAYMLRGIDTSELVDGKRFDVDGLFYVSEKTSWRGLTIFVLDRVPTDGLSDISADQ